jgi:hypothetical protein
MNNDNLYQNKIGIGIIVMSLSASTYTFELKHSIFNTNNPVSIPNHVDENLFSKQISPSIKLLDSKNEAKEISSDDNYFYYREHEVVEIPVVKKMRFKFNKPKIKVFEI